MKNIEINEVYTLFEEIKERIEKQGYNNPVIQPEKPDLSVINDVTDKLDKTIEEVRKPVRMEHYHTFSIASNKIFFSVMVMAIGFIISLFTIYYQREKIYTYKSNDLKYRYIKMKGEVTPIEISRLENIFENQQDSVKLIGKQVLQYEKAITEEAKSLEKARLKEQEAERFRKEAENLKQNK